MKFQLYGKDDCQYCFKAVYLLTNKGIEFEEFKLGKEFTREELFEMFPQAKTFPQIRIKDGPYIGGYTDLENFLNQI